MKTEQEQINKLASTIFEIIGRENIDRFTEDKNGNLVSVETVGIEGIAEAIINVGYGDVSEYKAEIRELKAEIRELKAEGYGSFSCRLCAHFGLRKHAQTSKD